MAMVYLHLLQSQKLIMLFIFRLRVALSAVHTRQDLENLAAALSRCINFQDTQIYGCNGYARL